MSNLEEDTVAVTICTELQQVLLHCDYLSKQLFPKGTAVNISC